jgi:hypothetical protein
MGKLRLGGLDLPITKEIEKAETQSETVREPSRGP